MSFESCQYDDPAKPETAGIRLANASARQTRGSPRIGYLLFDGQNADLPCALREFDGQSATLVLNGWLGVPGRFDLYVEPEGMRYACAITGRRGNAITVGLSEGRRETRPRSRPR